MYKILLYLLNIIHTIIGVLSFAPFIINETNILKYIFILQILIFMGWFVFSDKCFLTIIQNKLRNIIYKSIENKNEAKYILENILKYKINEKIFNKFFWIYIYTSIILNSLKLGIPYIGIGVMIIYQIYKKILIKN